MKSFWKKRFYLMLLLVLLIFARTLTTSLSLYSYFRDFSSQNMLTDHAESNVLIIAQRTRFGFDSTLNLKSFNAFSALAHWSPFIILLFIPETIMLDIRKLIISLITIYFEGSKYKDIFSFSQIA